MDVGAIVEAGVFFLFATITIGGALGLILAQRVAHSMLSLIFCFMAVSGIFILLGAEFLAAIQILVYLASVGLVVLFGAAGLFDPFNERALSLFFIGTLYNFSREIIKDVEDMDGDEGRNTYAMRVGAEKARLTSWFILLITLVALLAPFVMGVFDVQYIIFIGPGLFTLMNVKKYIFLAEDTAASRQIKSSMTYTMFGLIIAALM